MAAESEKRRGNNGIFIALAAGMGLGALVAAGFFQMRMPSSAPSIPTSVARAAPPVQGAAASHENENAGSGLQQAPSVAVSALPSVPFDDVSQHPAVADPRAPAPPAPAPLSTAQAPVPVSQMAVAPRPSHDSEATTHAPQGRPAAKQESDQSLEALMKRAVAITATPTEAAPSPPPAAEPTGAAAANLPLKPTLGAVQGAVGTLLPAARYCLGPDDPISHATVTFQSDGSVQAVSVSGSAAGQPAEGCIRSRLMAARVQPFSNPTFTWTVTVRPAS